MRALILSLALLATPLHAECTGQNILTTMDPATLAPITAAANAVPYPTGNFWTATKGDASLTIVGTYHLDDPRHDATMAALAPRIDAATTVLLEGGPEEEQAMKDRMATDPSIMIMPDTTLPQLLSAEEWERLSVAMAARGIPPFMAAKFQPWFLSVMLSIPVCKMAELDQDGLDGKITEHALAAGVPVRALERYDTVFTLFESFPVDDQLSMIRSSLAMESRADDYFTTMADLYFEGRSQMIWELMRAEAVALPGYTPEKIAADFAIMEEVLIHARNRAWIAVIEETAETGPALVAFGALHLPGEDGVLALLERAGWAIAPFTP